ncbi:phosphatase PAP2 family protein [Aeromonas jandaei]|uniref:phosphatase PAP2 family protein n=1 Tax=Aeromonas jandaei TaxID=650 RepID=UPI001ABF9551|nr:phosphatase PAP2 family protein [Aeromonas jandaei]QSR72086.1 phosphatase PAP2 family protein [Aeromonas jandaei]
MTQYVRLVIVPLFLLKVPAGHAGSGFETYGDIGQVVIPVAAALISWGEDDIEGLKQFGYSFATTTALVQGMKFTIDAERPSGSGQSFPSGHTAAAFSGASYLQIRYGWHYGLPAYIAAGAVGWSRENAEQHYWRDIIAGAAIATGISYLFTTPLSRNVVVAPVAMLGDARGVGLHYRY